MLTWALLGVALVGVAAVVYIIAQSSTKTAPVVATVPVAEKTAFQSKVSTPTEPTPAPDYAFNGADGKPLKISDFKGKVVVLNVWATWCGPCKVEMPTLAKMAASYAGKPVDVVAVSIDTPDAGAKAALFIAQNSPLKFYHDPSMKLIFKVGGQGAPTTVIYGKDGLEKARVSGEADWTSPEAKALIDKALAES
jgi:thiol-disulfide isomerase/thioredoxin